MRVLGRHALVGAALVFAASTVSAQAVTITNGSFETGTTPPNGTFITLGMNSTAIEGWTVISGSIDWINSYWQPSDGARSIDLSGNGPGAIAQTLTDLTVGQKYRISFDMAGNTDSGDAIKNLIGAVIAGVGFTFDVSGSSRTAMLWAARYFDFTATGTEHVLSFTSGEDNAYGAALDNVSIEAIPLPAALPLFGTALAGLGLIGWRRRGRAR